MKQIALKSLKLTNFKGIKNLEISFADDTKIFGANGTGKTTIADAWFWLLFGKDSTGRSDFEIKTLTSDGKAIEKIEHEVEGTIDIDGREQTLRRVYCEKWVTQRGAEEAVMTGHETKYFWNGAPMKQADYKKQVEEICDEYIFKLITSPTAFASLNWTERRDMLMKIVGEVSNAEIAGTNKAYMDLVRELANYKSEDDYRKMLQASIKKSKDEIKMIPARIDEAIRAKPSVTMSEAEVKSEIDRVNDDINEIDAIIDNKRAAVLASQKAFTAAENEKFKLKRDIAQIVFNAQEQAKKAVQKDFTTLVNLRAALDTKIAVVNRYTELIRDGNEERERLERNIGKTTKLIADKRAEWQAVNAETFDEHKLNCPTCSQILPESQAAKIVDEFNAKKIERLKEISGDGKAHKEYMEKLEAELKQVLKHLTELQSELNAAKDEVSAASEAVSKEENRLDNIETEDPKGIEERLLAENSQYRDLVSALKIAEENMPELEEINVDDLKAKRAELVSEINNLQSELLKHEQCKSSDKRVAELGEQEKKLAKEIAGVEKSIFAVENFVKAKMNYIESKVQSQFRYVSFRLFREQINGGIEPCCDILIDGVPLSDANTASKINGGIDIINTLSNHFGVTAPVVIDNRESVSEIIPTQSQLISLIVSPEHKVLTVL